jgi:sRNA-binding protein
MTEKRPTLTLRATLSPETKKQLADLLKVKKNKDPQEKKRRVQEALAWLCKTYPACFHLKNRKPLKKGILEDLFETLPTDAPSRTVLRQALAFYTQGLIYKNAILEKQPRIDLTGQVCTSDFSPEELSHAQEHVSLIQKKLKTKKEKQGKKPRFSQG